MGFEHFWETPSNSKKNFRLKIEKIATLDPLFLKTRFWKFKKIQKEILKKPYLNKTMIPSKNILWKLTKQNHY